VQVPLYLANQVTWLGTARLVMGLPFWALALWVSYLIIATPMRHHPKFVTEEAGDDSAVDGTPESGQ
jgi:hypothetical protein